MNICEVMQDVGQVYFLIMNFSSFMSKRQDQSECLQY